MSIMVLEVCDRTAALSKHHGILEHLVRSREVSSLRHAAHHRIYSRDSFREPLSSDLSGISIVLIATVDDSNSLRKVRDEQTKTHSGLTLRRYCITFLQ